MAPNRINEPGGFRSDVPPVNRVPVECLKRRVHVCDLTAWIALSECPPEISVVASPPLFKGHMVTDVHFCYGDIVSLSLKEWGYVTQGPPVQSVLYTDAVPLIVHADVLLKKGVRLKDLGDIKFFEVFFGASLNVLQFLIRFYYKVQKLCEYVPT